MHVEFLFLALSPVNRCIYTLVWILLRGQYFFISNICPSESPTYNKHPRADSAACLLISRNSSINHLGLYMLHCAAGGVGLGIRLKSGVLINQQKFFNQLFRVIFARWWPRQGSQYHNHNAHFFAGHRVILAVRQFAVYHLFIYFFIFCISRLPQGSLLFL